MPTHVGAACDTVHDPTATLALTMALTSPHRDSQARFAPLFPSALVQRVPGSAHDTIPFFADTGHAVVLFLAAVAGVPLRLDALLRGRARFVETRLAMEGARLAFRKVWAARYATDDFRLPPGAAPAAHCGRFGYPRGRSGCP